MFLLLAIPAHIQPGGFPLIFFVYFSSVQQYLFLIPQVEMHPGWQQQTLRAFCKPQGILVGAFSALGAPGTFYGRNDILSLPVVLELASKHKKTAAQVFIYLFMYCTINILSSLPFLGSAVLP